MKILSVGIKLFFSSGFRYLCGKQKIEPPDATGRQYAPLFLLFVKTDFDGKLTSKQEIERNSGIFDQFRSSPIFVRSSKI